LRMFMASARFLRPSTGASPATLLAVVLGLVSESWCSVRVLAQVAQHQVGSSTYGVVWRVLIVLRLHC
jgi:hypothetical protein